MGNRIKGFPDVPQDIPPAGQYYVNTSTPQQHKTTPPNHTLNVVGAFTYAHFPASGIRPSKPPVFADVLDFRLLAFAAAVSHAQDDGKHDDEDDSADRGLKPD